jgi:hypothetical protein
VARHDGEWLDPDAPLTYVELGAPFREEPTNEAQRHFRRMFFRCIVGALRHFRQRLDAAEAELDRREKAYRQATTRARLTVVDGGQPVGRGVRMGVRRCRLAEAPACPAPPKPCNSGMD